MRHELYIDTGNGEENEALFEHLLGQRDQFEAAYGRPVVWEDLPNARACRIADYRSDAVLNDESESSEFISWMIDAGERLRKALSAVDVPEH